MTSPELSQGEERISEEQLAQLEDAGLPLHDPVSYQSVNTLVEFHDLPINNFRMHFWLFDDRAAGKVDYTFTGHRRSFDRFRTLFPEFTEETRKLVDIFEVVNQDILYHGGNDGEHFTRAQHDTLYDAVIEPRLFFAWQMMGKLIDRSDPEYQGSVQRYGEKMAVLRMFQA